MKLLRLIPAATLIPLSCVYSALGVSGGSLNIQNFKENIPQAFTFDYSISVENKNFPKNVKKQDFFLQGPIFEKDQTPFFALCYNDKTYYLGSPESLFFQNNGDEFQPLYSEKENSTFLPVLQSVCFSKGKNAGESLRSVASTDNSEDSVVFFDFPIGNPTISFEDTIVSSEVQKKAANGEVDSVQLVLEGKGTLILQGQNLYPIDTFLSEKNGQPILQIQSEKNIGGDFAKVYLDGGVLKVLGNSHFCLPLEISRDSKLHVAKNKSCTLAKVNVTQALSPVSLMNEGEGALHIHEVNVAKGLEFSLQSIVSGTQLLEKTGEGHLVLNENRHSGGMLIQNGLVTIQSNTSLGTGLCSMKDQTQLHIPSNIAVSNPLDIEGRVIISSSNDSSSLLGKISGTGSIVKKGSAPLEIKSVNNSSGGIAIEEGVLIAKDQSNLGLGPIAIDSSSLVLKGNTRIAQKVQISNDAKIVSDSLLEISGPIHSVSNSILNLEGRGTISIENVIVDHQDQMVLKGTLSNVESLVKEGKGSLVLEVDHKTQAGLDVLGGVIIAPTIRNLGLGRIQISDATVSVIESGALENSIEIRGDSAISSMKTLEIKGTVLGHDQGSFNLAGSGEISVSQLQVNQGDRFTLKGVIHGSGDFEKKGLGTCFFNALNKIEGVLRIKEGVLEVSSNEALGSNSIYFQGGSFKTQAPMEISQDIYISKDASISAAVKSSFGGTVYVEESSKLFLDGPIFLSDFFITKGKTLQVEHAFSSEKTLKKTGDGGLYLRGENSLNKGVCLENGSLIIDTEKSLGLGDLEISGGEFHVKNHSLIKNTVNQLRSSTWIADKKCVVHGLLKGSDGVKIEAKGTGSIAFENIFVDQDASFTLSGNVQAEKISKTGFGNLLVDTPHKISSEIIVQEGNILPCNDVSLGNSKVTLHEHGRIGFNRNLSLANDFVFLSDNFFDTNDHHISLKGSIQQPSKLEKRGSGSLSVLSDRNSVLAWDIAEGLLKVESHLNLGSEVLKFSGGNLEILKSGEFPQKLEIAKNGQLISDKNIVLKNVVLGRDGVTLELKGSGAKEISKVYVGENDSFLLSGVVSNKGSLEKQGLGTLSLDSKNTFDGGVKVLEGHVLVSDSDSLGSKSVYLSKNSILMLQNNASPKINLETEGDIQIAVLDGSSHWDSSLSGKDKHLVKTGKGQLVLEGSNTYTGETHIKEGSLQISSNKNFNSTPIFLDGGEIVFSENITVNEVSVSSDSKANVENRKLVKISNLSGESTLHKVGSGNLMVPATSPFKGHLKVDEGALLFSSAGPISVKSLSGNGGLLRVDAAQILVIRGDQKSEFHGRIIGSGALVLDEQADITFSNIVQPKIAVQSGSVHINGAASNVSVTASGSLKGTGFIQGVVLDGGILAPGNSIGTITIDSLSFTPQSLFQVEISPIDASFAQVNLTADLGNAKVQVIPQEGTYTEGQMWKILSAGNLNGSTFDPEIMAPPRHNFSLSYENQEVFLTFLGLTPESMQQVFLGSFVDGPQATSSSIALSGLSSNRLNVAKYLNHQNPEILGSSFDTLASLEGSSLDHALDMISPARSSFASFTIQNVGFDLSSMVSSRLFNQRSMKDPMFSATIVKGKNFRDQDIVAGRLDSYESSFVSIDSSAKVKGGVRNVSEDHPFNIWGMGLGDFAKQMHEHQTPSFDLDSAIAVLGFDYGNLNKGLFGLALSYAHSKILEDGHFGNSHVNSVYGSVYGMYDVSDFFVQAQLWAGYQHISSLRNIDFTSYSAALRSSHASYSFNPHLGLGYDFYLGSKREFTLEPFADLDWVNLFEDAYQEEGSSVYDMSVKSRYSSMLQLETGLSSYWNGQFQTGNLIIKGGLSYILKAPFNTGSIESSLVSGAGSFHVEAFTSVQNIGSPSLEIFWQDENGAFASIGYKGEFSYVYISNQVLGKLGYNF